MELNLDNNKNLQMFRVVVSKLSEKIPFIGFGIELLNTLQEEQQRMVTEGRLTALENQNGYHCGNLLIDFSELFEYHLRFRKQYLCICIIEYLQRNLSEIATGWNREIAKSEILELVAQKGVDNVESNTQLALSELSREGLILLMPPMSDLHIECLTSIKVSEYFSFKTDVLFRDWDPEDDAKEVIKIAFNSPDKRVLFEELEHTNPTWSRHRINSALQFLLKNDYVLHYAKEYSGGETVMSKYRPNNEALQFAGL